jgi:hypothetical protein
MLALTHHLIVQVAARRVGIPVFDDYALLGDDIVIAHTQVAESYHHLMTNELGVEISLHKSLVSSNTFEFAKQLIRGDDNLSPIGPKNLLLCIKSLSGLVSLMVDMKNKGVVLSEDLITAMCSKIPTVPPSKWDMVKWTLLGPFGLVPTASGLTSTMSLVNSLSAVRMDSLITSIDDVLHLKRLEDHWRSIEKSTRAVTRLIY